MRTKTESKRAMRLGEAEQARLLAPRITRGKKGYSVCFLKIAAIAVVLSFLSTLPSAPAGQPHTASVAAAGGSSFGPSVMTNDNKANEQTSPFVTTMPNHGLFAVWQDGRAGYNAIYSSRSFDNGTTWSPNKRVDDPFFNTTLPRQPTATVTSNGTILVAWEDNRRNTFDYDIFFARSYNHGASFSKNVKVDDGPSGSWQEKPSLVVTIKGTIYVAWTDDRAGTLKIRGSYSLDNGVTWSVSRQIVPIGGGGQTDVSLAVNGNTIFAAFMDNVTRKTPHPFACSSINGGVSFSSPFRLDDTGRRGRAQYGLELASLASGGLAAIWADLRNGNADIYMTALASDGSYLVSNLRVEDDSSYLYSWQESPSIATDALGNIYAAWQDERTTGFPAVRFAILKVGKTVFNASVEVNKPGLTDMQMRPSVAVAYPGLAFVAYQDDKFGTDDIFTSAGKFSNLYGLMLVPGWNFISAFVDGVGYNASTLGLARGDVIVRWNDTTMGFDRTYVVGISPRSADFTISNSTGYWVFAVKPEVLNLVGTMPAVKQSKKVEVPGGGGWASVGFQSFNNTRKASDVLSLYSVPGGLASVASYDPVTMVYSTYVPGLPSSDFKIVPGKGYWVWCKVNGILSYQP